MARKTPGERGQLAENEATVAELRALSIRIGAIDLPPVFFPAHERHEIHPIKLEGYVVRPELGDLLHYIADMLEE